MLPEAAPRSHDVRRARQLWVNHGVVVSEQNWAAIISEVDWDGGMTLRTVRAYDRRGRLLGEARPR